MKFVRTKWIGDKLYEIYISIGRDGFFFELQLDWFVVTIAILSLRDVMK